MQIVFIFLQSLISNIKLLEGLLKTDPDNRNLLMLTCQGYAGYALGFVEDEEPERARKLYRRAKQYGIRMLQQSNQNIDQKKGCFRGGQQLPWNPENLYVPDIDYIGFDQSLQHQCNALLFRSRSPHLRP